MIKGLTPIQNVVVALVATVTGAYFPWIVQHVAGFPLTSELFVDTILSVFLAIAGWNVNSAIGKVTGRVSDASWKK